MDVLQYCGFLGWPVEVQKSLLLLHKEYVSAPNKWQKIAHELARQFPDRSIGNDQCRIKYRGLQQKYQRRTQHNKTSGNDHKDIDDWLAEAFEPEQEVLDSIQPLESSSLTEGKIMCNSMNMHVFHVN
jgi:hypothetical protein